MFLKIDKFSEIKFLHSDLHQDHNQGLNLHLEDLLFIYKQYSLETMIIMLKTFQRKKNGVNKYTTEMTNTIIQMSWFYSLYVHSQIETASSFSSRLEIGFVLDGGESIYSSYRLILL